MRRRALLSPVLLLLLAIGVVSAPADAQTKSKTPPKSTAKKPAPKPVPKPAPKTEPADVTCREQLGTGLRTKASFCFVLAGRDPADGVIVAIPPHTQATLTFNLHNRHTYSESEVKTNRGYHRYTATIGVLTMDNTLLSRAVVQNEFRTAAAEWLTEQAGPAAGLLLRCVTQLNRPDAVPVGLAAAVVCHPAAAGKLERAATRLEERFLGGEMPDAQAMLRGKREVLIDVALWIDNSSDVRLLIADQIRRVRQALEIELLQDHRWCSPRDATHQTTAMSGGTASGDRGLARACR